MSIRDQEIKRIETYAKALGIKILYKNNNEGNWEATWAIDGSEIEIFTKKHSSKTSIILSLIHELGHHFHWVHNNRKIPIKLSNALDKEKHTKQNREAIYVDEQNGARYHLDIYNELGLKIPKWKVEVERDHQLELYKYYYKYNEWPTLAERKQIRQKVKKKYLND